MRESKGYTEESEKINRDDSGIALTISFKKATVKKLRFRITGFFLRQNIGTYYQIKVISCHMKTIIFQNRTNFRKSLKKQTKKYLLYVGIN